MEPVLTATPVSLVAEGSGLSELVIRAQRGVFDFAIRFVPGGQGS